MRNQFELIADIIEKIEIGQKTLESVQEKLNLLEEKIKKSEPGVELWFSRLDYDLRVKSGEISFEDWFFEILKGSDL